MFSGIGVTKKVLSFLHTGQDLIIMGLKMSWALFGLSFTARVHDNDAVKNRKVFPLCFRIKERSVFTQILIKEYKRGSMHTIRLRNVLHKHVVFKVF